MNEHSQAGGTAFATNRRPPVQFRTASRERPQSGKGLAQRARAGACLARPDQRRDRNAVNTAGSALSAFLIRELGLGAVVRHEQCPWASATFAGVRHTLVFLVPEGRDAASLERQIEALDDDGIDLPGQVLADISGTQIGTKEDRKLFVEALTVEAV